MKKSFLVAVAFGTVLKVASPTDAGVFNHPLVALGLLYMGGNQQEQSGSHLKGQFGGEKSKKLPRYSTGPVAEQEKLNSKKEGSPDLKETMKQDWGL